MSETGWLIEAHNSRTGEFKARWWAGFNAEDQADGDGWTSDSVIAMRFARERDAQAYIDEACWTEAKPTEHAWGDAPPIPTGGGEADLRAALKALLDHVDINTCLHEDTHRGGLIWTICDACDAKWADDEGGFVPHVDGPAVAAARTILAAAPSQPSGGAKPRTVKAGFLPGSENHAEAMRFLGGVETGSLDAYDAGLLNDFGGGDVAWWQDYLRAELARAHDHYEALFLAAPPPAAGPSREEVARRLDPGVWTNFDSSPDHYNRLCWVHPSLDKADEILALFNGAGR